jgi:hypothetical protein
MPMLLGLLGCEPTVFTDGGLYFVGSPAVTSLTGGRLLQGTELCDAHVDCWFAQCPQAPLTGCLVVRDGAGAKVDPAACTPFDAPGEEVWTFDAVACAGGYPGWDLNDDTLAFTVYRPSEVALRPLLYETDLGLVPAQGAAFPADWLPADGEPWPIAAGSVFRFLPRAFRTAAPRAEVGFRTDELQPTALSSSGGPSPDLDVAPGGIVEVRYHPDDAPITLGASIDGYDWPLVDVAPADPTGAASVEVVVAYSGFDGTPAGARAVVRDGRGGLIFGAPVQWWLDDGQLALDRTSFPLPGDDYVAVLDQCVPPTENQGPRHAVLRASLGALTDTASVDWVANPDPTEPFAPNPSCVTGTGPPPPPPDPTGTTSAGDPSGDPVVVGVVGGRCGCGSAPGAGLGAVAAAALVARRRRYLPYR